MTKRLKVLRRSDLEAQEGGMTSGLFIAPKRTLLDHYLDTVRGGGEEGGGGGRRGRGSSSFDLEMSGEGQETEEEEEEYEMHQGPMFRLGSVVDEEEENNQEDPNSFAWCLMNLCITKLVQEAVKKVLTAAGLEVLGKYRLEH